MTARKALTASDKKSELAQQAEPIVIRSQVNGSYSKPVSSMFFWKKTLVSENGSIVNKKQYDAMIETLAERALAESRAAAQAELDELFGVASPKPTASK